MYAIALFPLTEAACFHLFHYCIVSPDLSTGKFKLDKGFGGENFNFSIPYSDVLGMTINIFSWLMVADNLQSFCQFIFRYCI